MTANRPKQIYTQEKAAHLVEVSIAVVSVSLLLGWQELILLNPLLKDEEEMVRQISFWVSGQDVVVSPFCALVH